MYIEDLIKEVTGKDCIKFDDLTKKWLQWYKGNVDEFHIYEEYNGVNKVSCKRKSLNMAKKVCEDWANLLMNEKTDVVAKDTKEQEELWKLLNSVKFWVKGNVGVEKTFALGAGAFVSSFDNKLKPRLQFVNKTKIYPITVDQDEIIECAFVNVNSRNVIIQLHIKGNIINEQYIPDDDGNYIVRTIVFEKQKETDDLGKLISDESVDTGSNIKWFQIIQPNIANNVDLSSPLGISIFANAIDTLQGVDLAYDGFCEEMRIGKAKVFIDKKLTRYDEKGEKILFDVNQTGFYYIGDGNQEKQPLTIYNPALRTDGYFNGINNALNLLSSKVGFGSNHYRFDNGGISTATQVISENSDMFRALKKHEILLQEAIIGVCKALMYINNNFTNNTYKFDLNGNLEVKFDDSIIEDKEAQKMSDRQDVNMNIMSKIQYRMKWYNEDEETAKKEIEKIKEENATNFGNFFSEE